MNTILPGLNAQEKNIQSQSAYQHKVLQISLYLSLALTLIGVTLSTPVVIQNGYGAAIPIIYILTIFFALITFIRRLPYELRSYGLLLLVLAQGLVGLFRPVITFDGRLPMLLFVLLATILMGTRGGIVAAVLGSIAIFSAGWNQSVFYIGDFAAHFAAGQLEWLGTGVVFMFISAAIIFAATVVQNTLATHLALQYYNNELLESENGNIKIENQDQSGKLELSQTHLAAYRTVSAQFMTESDPGPVLKSIIMALTESLKLDFSGIFLLDERKEYAKLKEGTGDVGRTLVESSHRVKIGDGSLVSQVVKTGEIKQVADTSKTPNFVPTPLLAGTRAETALPILINKQIVGVLDLQSDRPREFNLEEMRTLEWFAAQVGLAFEKGNDRSEIIRLRNELNSMYLQFTQQTWQAHLKRRRHSLSYRYRQNTIDKDIPQPPEVLEVAQKGEMVFVNDTTRPTTSRPMTKVAIPIKLRNQVLGVLDIQMDSSKLPQDMLPLLDAVANRLAVALENARLLEEIQNKAEREHLVGDISTKIRNSTNVDQVLRTTAAEIGRSFGISEVLVQLRPSEPKQGQLS